MATLFENFLILSVVLAGFVTFMAFGVFLASTAWRFVRRRSS